ncbi:MAG: histidinol-phosphatase [Clostridia bacterium]|nr:histidinol-phosphatase [Clostridia bacterium]
MRGLDLPKYGLRQELHCHTVFCDGKNTPEQMVLAAIQKGLGRIGFSGHAPMIFPQDYPMSEQGAREYRSEISTLKQKYEGKIEILCGIEQDVYSVEPSEPYDYVIGSAHYIRVDGEYIPVDMEPDALTQACRRHFGGDFLALCEAYFATVARVAALAPDIVGHIDLIAKFNRGGALFDETHPRYLAAAYRAVDALLPTGACFEINTGAISRGYRDTPYPSLPILSYIKSRGGRLLLTGDTHAAEHLCYAFDEWKHLLEE